MKLERGEYGVFRLDREGFEIGQIVRADNKKEAVTKAKYDVRNAEFIESGLQGRSSELRGRNRCGFLRKTGGKQCLRLSPFR